MEEEDEFDAIFQEDRGMDEGKEDIKAESFNYRVSMDKYQEVNSIVSLTRVTFLVTWTGTIDKIKNVLAT